LQHNDEDLSMSSYRQAVAEGAASAREAGRLASGDEVPWFDSVPGERLRIRVGAGNVGGRYAIMESVAQPMAGAPLHTHREDEIFHVLDGVLTFVIDGDRVEAGPGSIVVVPAGAVHAWRNFGDKPARCMVTFTPGGVEELFTRIGGLPPAELAEFAARYGTIVVGPPLES
jgi:quercetin dioxygenase-like cupin family protein